MFDLNADLDDLSTECGHRTLAFVRKGGKGGKHATIPIAPRTGRALDLYIVSTFIAGAADGTRTVGVGPR